MRFPLAYAPPLLVRNGFHARSFKMSFFVRSNLDPALAQFTVMVSTGALLFTLITPDSPFVARDVWIISEESYSGRRAARPVIPCESFFAATEAPAAGSCR